MDTTALVTTRRSLHGLAELILAGPQHRASGTIRLRIVPDGIATVAAPDLRISPEWLYRDGHPTAPLADATYTGVAAALNVDAGPPEGLYADGSGVTISENLSVDPAAAQMIFQAFELGDRTLRAFAPALTPVLWPEHFDLAVTLNDVNYGISPGDTHLDVPYAYVGPHHTRHGTFWNTPFGAAHPLTELPDLLKFFTEGRRNAR